MCDPLNELTSSHISISGNRIALLLMMYKSLSQRIPAMMIKHFKNGRLYLVYFKSIENQNLTQ